MSRRAVVRFFTPAGVKGTPGGVKVTPGGMEKLQLWEVSGTILDRPKNRAENNFSKEGKSFHFLKNLCEIYPKLPKVVTFPSRRG